MKKISDEDLIGYLLGALEPHEENRIEKALQEDLGLRDRLSALEEKLSGMPDRFVEIDPPEGLVDKTLNTIAIVDASISPDQNTGPQQGSEPETNKVEPVAREAKFSNYGQRPEREISGQSRNWSMLDLIVGAAVCFVVAAMLLPSIANSRFQSNLMICQDNLRQIGYNLASHSDAFDGKFAFPSQTDEWQASLFVKRMKDSGFDCLPYMICPNDPGRVETAEVFREAWDVELVMPEDDIAQSYHLPANEVYAEQVVSSEPVAQNVQHVIRRCNELRQTEAACGSYGFPAPQMTSSGVATIVIPGSPNLVLCADAACFDNPGYRSRNHAGRGQNVLLGDLSVNYICDTACLPTGDHIYTNSQGRVQPGVFPGDNTIYRGVMKDDSQQK